MVQFKVQYFKKKCIGAGVCEAVNPENWQVEESGKAKLEGSEFNEETGMFEKTAGESELESLKRAAEGCPKNVIHIINIETGEKLI